MLDILGNVFGRGKKDKNGQPIPPGSPSASRDASSSSTSDPFNVVESDTNGQANIVYPIILRDDVSTVVLRLQIFCSFLFGQSNQLFLLLFPPSASFSCHVYDLSCIVSMEVSFLPPSVLQRNTND